MKQAASESGRSPIRTTRAEAEAVLRILAGASILLLIYEAYTLVAAVLIPLLSNPDILQTDFHYYYDAAIRFRTDSSRLYLSSDDVLAGFAYPPPAIVPFMWLSRLPLGAALAVLTLSSYAVLVGALMLWLRYLAARGVMVDRAAAIAAVTIAAALGPTYSNAVFGQVNAWVLAFAVVFIAVGPRRPAAGGAALAAGVMLKIYPVLLMAIGLWNRSAWKRLAYAAATVAIAIAALLPVVPAGAYQTFWNDVLPARFDKTAVHILNQSLIAFIERFAIPPERFLNWTGDQVVVVGAAVRASNWGFGVAVTALLWLRATRGPRVEAVDSAASLIALAAVITPLGWGHTYMLVLPLLVLHLVSMRHASAVQAITVCACVAAMMIPAGRRFGFFEMFPAALQNAVYSRYLLATVILIALPPAYANDTDVRRP